MPKSLSRSKLEESESNAALQIRNQKERRVENARKLEHRRNFIGLRIAEFHRLRNFATYEKHFLLPLFMSPALFTFHDTIPTAHLTC